MAIGPLVPIHEHHLAIFQQWAKVLLASGNVIAENGNKCARSHTRRNLGDGSLVIVDVADTAKSGIYFDRNGKAVCTDFNADKSVE